MYVHTHVHVHVSPSPLSPDRSLTSSGRVGGCSVKEIAELEQQKY